MAFRKTLTLLRFACLLGLAPTRHAVPLFAFGLPFGCAPLCHVSTAVAPSQPTFTRGQKSRPRRAPRPPKSVSRTRPPKVACRWATVEGCNSVLVLFSLLQPVEGVFLRSASPLLGSFTRTLAAFTSPSTWKGAQAPPLGGGARTYCPTSTAVQFSSSTSTPSLPLGRCARVDRPQVPKVRHRRLPVRPKRPVRETMVGTKRLEDAL